MQRAHIKVLRSQSSILGIMSLFRKNLDFVAVDLFPPENFSSLRDHQNLERNHLLERSMYHLMIPARKAYISGSCNTHFLSGLLQHFEVLILSKVIGTFRCRIFHNFPVMKAASRRPQTRSRSRSRRVSLEVFLFKFPSCPFPLATFRTSSTNRKFSHQSIIEVARRSLSPKRKNGRDSAPTSCIRLS